MNRISLLSLFAVAFLATGESAFSAEHVDKSSAKQTATQQINDARAFAEQASSILGKQNEAANALRTRLSALEEEMLAQAKKVDEARARQSISKSSLEADKTEEKRLAHKAATSQVLQEMASLASKEKEAAELSKQLASILSYVQLHQKTIKDVEDHIKTAEGDLLLLDKVSDYAPVSRNIRLNTSRAKGNSRKVIADSPGYANNQGTEILASTDSSGSATALSSFTVNHALDSTLITTELAKAYIPAFSNTLHGTFNFGLIASASLPATNENVDEYVTAQALTRHGGLVNVYINLFAVDPRRYLEEDEETSSIFGDRAYAVNRYYFHNRKSNQLLGYVTHGIGVKAIRKSLESENYDLTAVGSGFLGFGVDGPLIDASDDRKTGGISLEGSVTANIGNKSILREVFSSANATADFYSANVTFKAFMAESFSVSLSYSTGLGGETRGCLDGEVVSLGISYNR